MGLSAPRWRDRRHEWGEEWGGISFVSLLGVWGSVAWAPL